MLKNASPLNDSYSCLVVHKGVTLRILTTKKGLLARPLDFFYVLPGLTRIKIENLEKTKFMVLAKKSLCMPYLNNAAS